MCTEVYVHHIPRVQNLRNGQSKPSDTERTWWRVMITYFHVSQILFTSFDIAEN